jgi:hypothetical protein
MPAQQRPRRHQPPEGRHQPPAEEPPDPLEGLFYRPNMNQIRQEPLPASHHDERDQEAVRQNEAFAHGYESPQSREGQGTVPGHLTPGPEDPRTAPTQITGAEPGDGRVRRVRRVSRAVRGKPDGEVDPHA